MIIVADSNKLLLNLHITMRINLKGAVKPEHGNKGTLKLAL